MQLPPEVDWFYWRLLTHKNLHVSSRDIEESWSLIDMWEANEVLNALDAAEMEAHVRASRDRR